MIHFWCFSLLNIEITVENIRIPFLLFIDTIPRHDDLTILKDIPIFRSTQNRWLAVCPLKGLCFGTI